MFLHEIHNIGGQKPISEPVNVWTKEYEGTFRQKQFHTNEFLEFVIDASIVFDRWNGSGMYEGVIQVFSSTESGESGEWTDSATFDNELETLAFINECLVKWEFDVRVNTTRFKYTCGYKEDSEKMEET